jgi:hypothetical protein
MTKSRMSKTGKKRTACVTGEEKSGNMADFMG